jgi:Transglycosylase-like domain
MTFATMVAGTAVKSVMAVTVSLHPGAAQAAGHYTVVHQGDSLSAISLHEYGTAADWPALWWANRRQVPDPSMIRPGERLRVPGHPRTGTWLVRAAIAASHPGRARAGGHPVVISEAHSARRARATATYRAAPGSFQACVIQRESGGNPRAVNPSSGAGGLYGFLPSTWHGLGFSGLPENAPVSVQNAAFEKEYAQSGTSAWAPYDGC